MPRALGSMMLRPGLGYIDDTYGDNQAYHVPFIKSLDDMAVIELTNFAMRVRVNDAIITRPSVTTTITNPAFDAAGANNAITSGSITAAGATWGTTTYTAVPLTYVAGTVAQAAVGTIVFDPAPPNNAFASTYTLVINGTTWSFVQTGTVPSGNQTEIGFTTQQTVTQFVSQLNASTDANISKASYAAYPVEDGSGSWGVRITYKMTGTAGNAFTLAQTMPGSSDAWILSGATLSGGTAATGSSTGTGSGATATLTAVGNVITAVVIVSGGIGYQDGDILTYAGGPGTGFTYTITGVNDGLTGWVDHDEAGAMSSWKLGSYMGLIGNGASRAIRSQQVTVAGGNVGIEHALRIVVVRGNVTLRVGTTLGDDSYIADTTLGPGTHSLALTPTGNFYIQVSSYARYTSLIQSINIEAAGDMVLSAPWAIADLPLLRGDQSADVIFLACDKASGGGIGYPQYKIERRSTRSWSIVQYLVDDGPFKLINTNSSITLAVGAISGETTMVSSIPFFKTSHVGCLFRATSSAQNVSAVLAGANQFSDPIVVTGVGAARFLTIAATGTFVGTWSLQRSVGNATDWVTIDTGTDATSLNNSGFNDGFDNSTMYYRVGFESGNYTSGTLNAFLFFPVGGITGIARVTDYTDSTHVSVQILKAFGSTDADDTWAEGMWSAKSGYPTTTALNEGRLWGIGRDSIVGSVSDAFASIDDTVVGDSGPIIRTIGSGPVDRINWAIPLLRFALGGQMAEHFIFSDALDAPLTPTNNNIRAPSNKGSAAVNAVKLNTDAIFVDKSGTRLYTVAYDNLYQKYANEELTVFCPEIGLPSIIKIALQQQPDVRLHCLRSDGTVGVLVYDKIEEVQCWIDVTTSGAAGFVEDILVMPGLVEDAVYYSVKRTIGGVTKRFYEKWALESECIGGTLNKNADSFVVFNSGGAATATITGLGHLEGQAVVVWGDGKDLSPLVASGTYPNLTYTPTTYTVSSGQITVPTAVVHAVVGLFYDASYQGTKLAYGAALGTALNQTKINNYLGLILANTHCQGVLYGRDFTSMQTLPLVEDGAVVDPDTIWGEYDKEPHEFDGDWSTDERICLYGAAPRPATVLGLTVSVQSNDTA